MLMLSNKKTVYSLPIWWRKYVLVVTYYFTKSSSHQQGNVLMLIFYFEDEQVEQWQEVDHLQSHNNGITVWAQHFLLKENKETGQRITLYLTSKPLVRQILKYKTI